MAPLLPTVNLRCAETNSCQVNIDFGHILTRIPWNKPSQNGKIKYASYMTLKLSVSKKTIKSLHLTVTQSVCKTPSGEKAIGSEQI